MSGNEPNKRISGGKGWGDGGPNGEIWKKQTKKREVTNFIGILGFPDSEVFLPRPALCDSVSFFLVIEKKGLEYRARGNNMTF